MATSKVQQIKIETPQNLDSIFNLECFKYLEMKGLFKTIFAYLTQIGLKLEDLDDQLGSIPDFSDLQKKLKEMEKRQNELGLEAKLGKDDLASFKKYVDDRFQSNESSTRESFGSVEERLERLEEEVELLKQRPQRATIEAPAEINYEGLCSQDDYQNLLRELGLVQKRNLEQDDRLTNNELRIEKLEKKIQDPLDRIMALEQRVELVYNEIKNRVTVQDLYNELIKKADLNGVKALEATIIRLNDLLNDLTSQFADRVENDKAHKLLQKNLKNLYDLFMSLKGEGNEDDPMFTTKGLNCASCAKGVQNMLGFRADHLSWNNFPFKEPGHRMAKLGQGFSKLYTKSQFEGSYYNGPSMANQAHTSAADLNDAVSNEMGGSNDRHSRMNKMRVSSNQNMKRARPMTAKVNKGGLY
uniref:Uncharacterized protein n=1 Tax=Strombidium rassoulzadegani TaxID=1082188 RepID=A0A7S3FZ34_9SPIT